LLQVETAAAGINGPSEVDSRDSHGANHHNRCKYMNRAQEINPLNSPTAAQGVGSPVRGTSATSVAGAPCQVAGSGRTMPLINRLRVASASRCNAMPLVRPNNAAPEGSPDQSEQSGQVHSVNIEGRLYAWRSATITVREIRRMANLPPGQAVVCEDDEGFERTLAEDEVVTLKPGLRHGRASKYKRGSHA
jgi:hypothetical protein